MTTHRDTARRSLALASVGAGVIHLALGPDHMTEWVVLGSGFYVSGALQIAWGAALAVRESRAVTLLGLLGSLLFIGVWAVSRTSGLPVGPEAFVPEGVGLADQVCVGLEAVVGVGALLLLRRPNAGRAPSSRTLAHGFVAGVAVLVVTSTGVAVAAPGHEHATGAPCPVSAAASATGVDANHDGADDGVADYFACQLVHEHDGGHVGYRPLKLS